MAFETKIKMRLKYAEKLRTFRLKKKIAVDYLKTRV